MLSMFKNFISRNPRTVETLSTAAFFTAGSSATVLLTHHYTKDLPPEEREIYWNNYMDPDSCRDALNKYQHTKRKPK